MFATNFYGTDVTDSILTRWLLRFEFQLPHPILSPVLATDKETIRNFIICFSLKNIILGTHFCYWHCFKNSAFKALYSLELGPFFVSWFPSFGKRYENDLNDNFYQWPKLCIGFDVEADIQILKGIKYIHMNWAASFFPRCVSIKKSGSSCKMN